MLLMFVNSLCSSKKNIYISKKGWWRQLVLFNMVESFFFFFFTVKLLEYEHLHFAKQLVLTASKQLNVAVIRTNKHVNQMQQSNYFN